MIACGREPAARRDQHIAQGDAFFRDGHFPQATVEYQKAVTADPRSSAARQRLAEGYVRIGMVEFAIKEYGRAADLAPERADLAMQTATLLLAERRFENAEVFARQAVARGPAVGAAHLLLGNALVGLASVTDINAPVALEPTAPGADARFKEAESEYRAAIALEPDAPLPRVALGRLQEALGHTNDAEREYSRARSIKGGEVPARRALAHLYLAAHRQPEAEAELRALAKALKTPDGYLELADYYIALSRWSEARGVLEPLLDRITVFVAVRVQLAAVEFQSGRLTRAHQLIDEVLEPYPNNPKALLLKARLLRVEGKFDDALIRARSAVNEDPGGVVARLELASLYVLKHNRDEALRVLHGLTSAAEKVEIQMELARLYLDRSDVARARVAAERAMTLSPALTVARALFVRALVRDGRLPEAEAAIRLVPAGNQSADVWMAKGDLLAARGRSSEARRAYEQSLSLEPDNPDALTTLVRFEMTQHLFGAIRTQLAAAGPSSRAPGDAVLRRRLLAEATAAEGNVSSARQMLQALVDADATDAESWVVLAELQRRAGRLSEAQAAAEQAVHQQPLWPHATLLLGDILAAQGKGADARARYEQLLKLDPEATGVKARLGR